MLGNPVCSCCWGVFFRQLEPQADDYLCWLLRRYHDCTPNIFMQLRLLDSLEYLYTHYLTGFDSYIIIIQYLFCLLVYCSLFLLCQPRPAKPSPSHVYVNRANMCILKAQPNKMRSELCSRWLAMVLEFNSF
jgi:hypothetical protein